MGLKEEKGEILIPPHLNLKVECIASIYDFKEELMTEKKKEKRSIYTIRKRLFKNLEGN